MPKILDNIDLKLIDDLRVSMQSAVRADFCVGYFNLRGWKLIDDLADQWSGQGDARTRLMVGMQELPEGELRSSLTLLEQPGSLDNQTAVRLKRRVAEQFRQQLMLGAPSNSDEAGLRRLSRQLKSGKVLKLPRPLTQRDLMRAKARTRGQVTPGEISATSRCRSVPRKPRQGSGDQQRVA